MLSNDRFVFSSTHFWAGKTYVENFWKFLKRSWEVWMVMGHHGSTPFVLTPSRFGTYDQTLSASECPNFAFKLEGLWFDLCIYVNVSCISGEKCKSYCPSQRFLDWPHRHKWFPFFNWIQLLAHTAHVGIECPRRHFQPMCCKCESEMSCTMTLPEASRWLEQKIRPKVCADLSWGPQEPHVKQIWTSINTVDAWRGPCVCPYSFCASSLSLAHKPPTNFHSDARKRWD